MSLADEALKREQLRYERLVKEFVADLRALADTVERESKVTDKRFGVVSTFVPAVYDMQVAVQNTLSQRNLPKIMEVAGECDFWRGVIAGENYDPDYRYKET